MTTYLTHRFAVAMATAFVIMAAALLPQSAQAAVPVELTVNQQQNPSYGVAPTEVPVTQAGIPVTVIADGVVHDATTNSSGVISVDIADPDAGDVIIAYINGSSEYTAVSFTKAQGGSSPIDLADLYVNSVTVKDARSGSQTWSTFGAEIAPILSGIVDTDVSSLVTVSGTNVTATAGVFFIDAPQHTFQLDGSLSVTGSILALSNFVGSSHAVTTGNNFFFVVGASMTTGTLTFGGQFVPFDYVGVPPFSAGTSTVQCTGTACAIYESNTFYNLSIVDSTDNNVSQAVTFQSGKTQTITNALSLKGLSGEQLTVNASTASSAATIALTGAATLDSRNVSMRDNTLTDSSTALTTPVDPCGSTNVSNTTNWFTGGAGTSTDSCDPVVAPEEDLESSFTVTQRINAPKIVRGAYRVLLNKHVEYEVYIRNTGETTLTTIPLETRYSKKWLKFVSASKQSVNTTNDGQINWVNVAPTGGLLPGQTTTVKVKYKVVGRSLFPIHRILGHEVRVKGVVDSLTDTLAMVKGKNKSVIVR